MTSTTATPSFKSMTRDGIVKRADAMRMRIEDIHAEPGFNLRDENGIDANGQTFQESIEALADYIIGGGVVPDLEVRPRAEGGVWLVDGHRRRLAYLLAEAKGANIRDANGDLWLGVKAFTGNDADRVARIITSAEGRSLSLLEVAKGYARLIGFKWTPQQIADKVGKTRQHVDQALILANANSDVQAMVAGGSVSATSAINAVRAHGDGAGGVLDAAVTQAKATGKNRATAGAIKGKPLPRKLVDELEPVLERFAQTTHTGTMSVDSSVVAELLDIIASIRETRAKQASRGQADAVKAAQKPLPVDA